MTFKNAILWFRRDLRTADHPAFEAAIRHATSHGGGVLAVFVLDPFLIGRSGPNRLAYLYRSLRSLVADGVPLTLIEGQPEAALADLVRAHSAEVFATSDFAPFGAARDQRVGEALASFGSALHLIDSNYVIAPGTVLKGDGTPFKVFTPFSRVWLTHATGVQPAPRIKLSAVPWLNHAKSCCDIPLDPAAASNGLGVAGEKAAWKRARTFLANNMHTYDEARNLPGLDMTSRLSADLKFGAIHPRQLLPLIVEFPSNGATVFRTELCWREFYADVLFARPDTVCEPFVASMRTIETDEGPSADTKFEKWCRGQTGYPFIDAAMRQLLHEGWMHNRLRMATASFLVKDLHLPWQRGAKWFMSQLVDGDVASNQHGWQWTAGCGTDASPYYRVFNPVTQGQKFDADGTYIRRWVPELAKFAGGKAIHEPWTIGGVPGYPAPMVDHARERTIALERHAAAKGGIHG